MTVDKPEEWPERENLDSVGPQIHTVWGWVEWNGDIKSSQQVVKYLLVSHCPFLKRTKMTSWCQVQVQCVWLWLIRSKSWAQKTYDRSSQEVSLNIWSGNSSKFVWVTAILLCSWNTAPLMWACHAGQSCASIFHVSQLIPEFFRQSFRVSLYHFFWSLCKHLPCMSSP